MRAILTYHSLDDSGSPISLAPDVFESHVRFLASGRLRVVPLAELVALPDDADAVALTFDDGFANFSTVALPLVTAHALPATVFVVSDHTGGTNAWGGRDWPGIPTLPLMDWAALERVAAAGIQIGAHTRRHPDLTALASDALDDEIGGCVTAIERALGVRPTALAYPYGHVSDAVVGVVREWCELACTTELRVLEARDDRLRLPRLDAWYFRRAGQLEQWGTAPFRRRLWLRARGRELRRLVLARRGASGWAGGTT